MSCTLAGGTTGCSMSPFLFSFCVCVVIYWLWSPLQPQIFQFSSPHCFLPSLSHCLCSGPTYLVPGALYLLNLPLREEKETHTAYQWSIRLHLSCGWLSCRGVNCPRPFIRQVLFIYKPSIMWSTNIRREEWGATASVPCFSDSLPVAITYFSFIWSRFALLKEASTDRVWREMLQLC